MCAKECTSKILNVHNRMGDINIDDEPVQGGPHTPKHEVNLVSDGTVEQDTNLAHWKKPFQILKPPLSDFLLAGVNTERLLNVSVLLQMYVYTHDQR
jgi:hypothetical protein